jgi:hypothetical protein
MIKVIKFKKLKTGAKKYEITFNKNGKVYTRKFGASGASDYTKHKDKDRRERYITRHKKDLKTNDPMRPGYLSMYILWNKPTVAASLADYKRRLNSFNRNGKFPKAITGSKKLKFGTLVEFETENSYLDKLPSDVRDLIQREVSASKLQKGFRDRERVSELLKEFLDHVNTYYIEPERRKSIYDTRRINYDLWFDNYKREPRVATEKHNTYPGFMGKWFMRVAKLPSESFFIRDKDSIDITYMVREYLSKLKNATTVYDYPTSLLIHKEDVENIASSLIAILIKSGFPISRIPPGVLGEISDYFPDLIEGSFWREAYSYWDSKGFRNFYRESPKNRFGKSSCTKKKRSPMKRVNLTKFGYTIESAQNHMLHSLLSGNDLEKNLRDTITRICRSNFTAESCQKLFTYFILNLYHTFDLKIPYAPRGFKGISLEYDKSYNNNLKDLLYLLQDHSFGTFHNARLASRLYEILFKRG